MPVTNKIKNLMMELGGTLEYEDATEPFPLTGTKNGLRRAKAGRCDHCYYSCSLYDAGYRANVVSEKFTYIQFGDFESVWTRYKNDKDMQEDIRLNDASRFEDIQVGEDRILEVPKGSDVKDYKRNRREAIKKGEVITRGRSPSVYPVVRKDHTRAY